jgi:uncharacterized membrane protein SpoIIM required for sporulation
VNLERFERERGDSWASLEALVKRAGDRPERLGEEGVRSLGALYRGAAADLAFARRRFPGDPVTARLEALVLRARASVYARSGGRGSLWSFVAREYWVRLAERPWLVFAAWAVLLAPAVLGAVWGAVDPGAAAGVVPGQFQAAADPPAAGRDFDTATATAFSASVMFNNIGVALLAFAGGVAFAVPTVISLFYNGMILGVLGGIAVGAGHGTAFLRLVSSHGPLEISCIVAGGIAGLRMGWALIRPGPSTRGTALRREARPAVEIAVGTAPWLVVCGVCEGFLTGPGIPVGFQALIGASLFVLFWGLVVVRGRLASRKPRR